MRRKDFGFTGFVRRWFAARYPLIITTCLIALVMYGNFAFVNAAAMERRLNVKAMMLHQFTWQQFLVAAAVLTLVWYGLLFVSWYLKGKGSLNASGPDNGRGGPAGAGAGGSGEPLRHAWEKGVDVLNEGTAADDDLMGVSQGPEGVSRVSMSDFSFAAPVESPGRVGSVDGVGAAQDTDEAAGAAVSEAAARVSDTGSFLQGTVADFLEELKPVFDYAARYQKGLPVFLEHLRALLGRYPDVLESANWEAVAEHICALAADQLPFEISPQDIEEFLEQEAD